MGHLPSKSVLLLLASLTIIHCASLGTKREETIRIATQRNPLTIIEIPLEEYLIGVLQNEVFPNWPLEALKAQAVASRTYALYRREHPRTGENYDLESSVKDQLYLPETKTSPLILQAVQETEGEYLTYDDKIIPAFFHSTCGGVSEKAKDVWGEPDISPLNQVHDDPYCEEAPYYFWEYEFALPGTDVDLKVLRKTDSGRIDNLLLASTDHQEEFKGNDFRRRFGFDKVKSTLFDIYPEEGEARLVGRGYGHGVGLCQWGAKGMADQGFHYEEILDFYYPGAGLKQKRR
ncbi:MAG: SpoIID/LytB domain-containing protein [Deltaproteobacteria bacterium]|nr:SpoIID/LytB domain-containing protein [Deltaproteobacteria bacterium]